VIINKEVSDLVQRRSTRQKKYLQSKLDEIDTFFSAEDLFEIANKEHEKIGIATVYRFLNELKSRNLLYAYRCNGRTVFSKENKSHCHFICEKTGKVTHFTIDSLDFLKDKIPGSIKSFQLEVRGICKDNCEACFTKST
jgi:Fe2+ or Zn2+ uptake regulation protein